MLTLKKFIAAALMVCVLLIVGCGGIQSGTVIGKKFVPAHVEQELTIVGDVQIWNDVKIPDRWYITISQQDKNGRMKTNTFTVTKQYYDDLREGDWVDFSKK